MAATPLVRKGLSQTRITALDGFAKKLSNRVRSGSADFLPEVTVGRIDGWQRWMVEDLDIFSE
jgi:hypothetical protein